MGKSKKPQTSKNRNGQDSSSDKPTKLRSRKRSYSFSAECDIESLFQAGMLLLFNLKSDDEWLMAETLLTHAAQEGHIGAQLQLARMFDSGSPFNGQRDPEKANVWSRSAAEQGDGEAMMAFTLADHLLRHRGQIGALGHFPISD